MQPLELTAMLAGFERRGPGTDSERRAARRLARELRAEHHRVAIETFWCRPNWALAQAWHVALALAGSLISVSQPTLGAALIGGALLFTLADELLGLSPGRRLTPERASQNVVAKPQTEPEREPPPVTLLITCNYDAGRTGLVHRDVLRRPAARLRQKTGPAAFGAIAALALTMIWSLAIAIIRATAHHSAHSLGAIQLPPTVALVVALALLLEAAAAAHGPGANDNASGTAVAASAFLALADNPPRDLGVELVLAGAGEGGGIGLKRHLRRHRRELTRANTIVLGIAPCGSGHLRYWRSDGRLIPLGYARPLRQLAANQRTARAHRGRGQTPALSARSRGLPAIAIGRLEDAAGLAPRSHQPTDTASTIDEAALNNTLEYALLLIDEIDAWLAAAAPAPATPALASPAPATPA
jgi:Peptidase family M28